jgi:hypothetical protein
VARPSVSSVSYGSRSHASDNWGRGGVTIRDLPPRRNLANDFDYSSSSHTGGGDMRHRADVNSPDKRHWPQATEISPDRRHRLQANEQHRGKEPVSNVMKTNQRGTFTRRPRNPPESTKNSTPTVPLGTRKRGPK